MRQFIIQLFYYLLQMIVISLPIESKADTAPVIMQCHQHLSRFLQSCRHGWDQPPSAMTQPAYDIESKLLEKSCTDAFNLISTHCSDQGLKISEIDNNIKTNQRIIDSRHNEVVSLYQQSARLATQPNPSISNSIQNKNACDAGLGDLSDSEKEHMKQYCTGFIDSAHFCVSIIKPGSNSIGAADLVNDCSFDIVTYQRTCSNGDMSDWVLVKNDAHQENILALYDENGNYSYKFKYYACRSNGTLWRD